MNRIEKAAEFGARMGKQAADNQFIGRPQAPGITALPANWRNMPTPAPRQAPMLGFNPQSAATAEANRMLSGENIPAGMSKQQYFKDLNERMYQQKQNPRAGTAIGEAKRLDEASRGDAFNTMASTLGTMGAGHAIGHGLHGVGHKAVEHLAKRVPGATSTINTAARYGVPYASNLTGHAIASKGIEALGGTPAHMSTSASGMPATGPIMDAAKGIYTAINHTNPTVAQARGITR